METLGALIVRSSLSFNKTPNALKHLHTDVPRSSEVKHLNRVEVINDIAVSGGFVEFRHASAKIASIKIIER